MLKQNRSSAQSEASYYAFRRFRDQIERKPMRPDQQRSEMVRASRHQIRNQVRPQYDKKLGGDGGTD